MKKAKPQLKDHPFLKGLSPENVALLAENAREVKFEPGQILFKEGAVADQFFLIQSGKIALEYEDAKRGNFSVQTLGEGDALGWSWMFPPFQWHLQARATKGGKAFCLKGPDLLALSEKNPDLGYELTKRVTQVVILRLQATRQRLLESEGIPPSVSPTK